MWDYAQAGQLMTALSVAAEDCIYCQTSLLRLPAVQFETGNKRLFAQLSLCPVCGWWTVYRVHQGEHPRIPEIEGYSGSIGSLKELDLADISVPLKEVRQYLLVKKDSIFQAHPKRFEEIVCSVFRDLGWTARVTAYSGDEGVDVILDDSSGSTVGVQVKRNNDKRRVEAEQIRSLAGALVLGGHTRGIFVTSSKFRRGAVKAAQRFSAIGYPIELMDTPKFLAALGIAQRQAFHLEEERAVAYILGKNVHLGSGLAADFRPGENLLDREVVASTWLGHELFDLRENTLV